MEFSRQEYWSGLPFPSPVDHALSYLSTLTHPSWVAPQVWLGFFELDKAVVQVWLDWLVFCEYGFSVSALWCPLGTPTILLGFLLSWAWGLSSRLFQQSTAAAPYLERVVMCSKFISPYQHAFYNISQAIFLVVIALFLGKVIIFSSPRYILPSRQASFSDCLPLMGWHPSGQ